MTHGQCQNDGTCVPDELSPDKTPTEEKGTEALWDKSRLREAAKSAQLSDKRKRQLQVGLSAAVNVRDDKNRPKVRPAVLSRPVLSGADGDRAGRLPALQCCSQSLPLKLKGPAGALSNAQCQ
ncbi:unnamed protein product [Pleuronectes platessa]|uniref:Uncharacterized protein n=1 Tax=Pleuronectes platessa TaxID=8262 RepID=A0A9N7VI07_PLEPL|nr:unnamed protein product [Pleuronectes platessa]